MGLKWVKYLVIGLAALAMCVSCCPCKNLASTSETKISDSVNVTTTITPKEVSVFTKEDSVKIQSMVKCPPSGILNVPETVKKSKNATIKQGIKDNKMYASCKCDALEVKVKYQDKVIEIYRKHAENTKAVQVVEVEKIPKWAQVLAWIGAISILLIIIFLVINIYNKFK